MGALDIKASFSYTSSHKKVFLSIVVCQSTLTLQTLAEEKRPKCVPPRRDRSILNLAEASTGADGVLRCECNVRVYTGKKVEDIIYVKVHPWKETWKKGR